MTSLISQLSEQRHSSKSTSMAPAFSNLHESFLQAKKLNKLREIAQRSDDNESPNEHEDSSNNKKESRPPLKRLLRGSSPQGNLRTEDMQKREKEMDFDDPEDENWELDSSVSLNFKPKKINTRTRTSTRYHDSNNDHGGMNNEEKTGIRTRGLLRKKVVLNDEDGDYEAKQSLLDESDEYNSDGNGNEYRRNRLRKKPVKKSYNEEEEEEYKDSDDEFMKKKQKKQFISNHVNNNTYQLKRKERPTFEEEEEEEEKNNNNYAGRTRNKKLKMSVFSDDNNSLNGESSRPTKNRIFTSFSRNFENLPMNSIICARCEREGATVKCNSFQCEQFFHEECANKRGLEKDDLHFYCFECWLNKKRSNLGPQTLEPQIIDFSRNWLDFDEQIERHYVPQIGDRVYYLFQGHEDFLREYWEILDYEVNNRESLLPFIYFPSLKSPTLCEIVAVEYMFPKIRNKKMLKKMWILNVLMNVTLKEIGGQELGFKIQFCHGENIKSFLVLKDIFEYSKEMMKGLEGNQMISYFKGFQEHSAQILEVKSGFFQKFKGFLDKSKRKGIYEHLLEHGEDHWIRR